MRAIELCSSSLLVLGACALIGCSSSETTPSEPGASQGNEAPPDPPAPLTGSTPVTKLTDGQISGILAAVDQSEIEQAEVALSKSKNAGVRAYATHMVQQHTASKQNASQLASQKTELAVAESPNATNLKASGAQTLEQLKAADAATFDQVYLSSQVQQHTDALKMIDEQLLPAVSEPALRDHLSSARGMVEQHLEQAKKLQQQ